MHPVECAEYTVLQGLMNEPAFNWWVGFVLNKQERIILLVKKRNTRYLKRNETQQGVNLLEGAQMNFVMLIIKSLKLMAGPLCAGPLLDVNCLFN